MIKAYYEDSSKDKFTCRIEDKIIIDSNTYYLFDTAPFFPGGGGEARDEGTANGKALVDALENGEKVYYSFEDEIGDIGWNVECIIDTDLRKRRSIMHTSQHIISALFEDILGMHTDSVHFSDTYATIDLSGSGFGEDRIAEIEDKANEIVRSCIALQFRIADKSELGTLPLRKAIGEDIDFPRLVNIPGVDLSLCCAVHADNTGQIGMIKILKTETKNSVVRLTFTAGSSAVNDYRMKNDAILKINAMLSSTTDTVVERLIKKEDDFNALKKQFAKLKETVNSIEADRLADSEHTLIMAEGDFDDMKSLGSLLVAKAGKAFVGIDRTQNKLIIYQNLDRPVNLIINKLKNDYDIRGGGNALSGQMMCSDNLEEIVELVARYFDPAEFLNTETQE